MAAPFVPLLGQCLRLTGAVDVVTLATRCLCTLLTWKVEVESSFVQAVGKCVREVRFLISHEVDLTVTVLI